MTVLRSLPLRRLPRAAAAAWVTLAAVAAVVSSVTPAAAHGREVLISLEAVAGDPPGTAEITATVSFQDDGHAADGVALATTAVSGGEQVEVELAPAGEPGTYAGTAELPPGSWEISTEATGDHSGTAVTELTVATPETTAPTTTTPPSTTSTPAAALPAGPSAAGGEGGGAGLVLVLVAAALVLLGAAVLVWRRVRRA